MISGAEVYHVVEAVLPLYVAMALGYASVQGNVLTVDQCNGINRFVAVFGVPMLIFRLTSSNNPYAMNARFIAADTLQKLFVLIALVAWSRLSRKGSIAWVITLFSLATLPNSIIMGVPVLGGMYGSAISEPLMVQIVVMQGGFWYAVVVYMYEYMLAQQSIEEQMVAEMPVTAERNIVDMPIAVERGDVVVDPLVIPISAEGVDILVAEKEDDDDTAVEVPVFEEKETVVHVAVEEMRRRTTLFILLTVGKKIIKTPLIYASILGFIWSFIAFRFGIKMPTIVDNSLSIISSSAVGLSMFGVGAFMAHQNRFIACDYSLAILAMVMKFLIGPAVMAASSLLVGLSGVHLSISITQAALPVTILSFVYAQMYNVHADVMSTGVIVGMALSFPIALLYYVLLGL